MNNPKTGHFPPDRRLGLFIHAVMIVVLVAVSIFGLVNLSKASVGLFFVLYLLMALLAFVPIPFLGYRAYALLRADYYIDRDSLAMLWGLRIEDIPLTDIEWVRPASDLTRPLLLPRSAPARCYPWHPPPPRSGTGGVHCLQLAKSDPDRHIEADFCNLASKCRRTRSNLCTCHRNGKPDTHGGKIRLPIVYHYSGLGQPHCPPPVDQRHPAQPGSDCRGEPSHPVAHTDPIRVQPIWGAERSRRLLTTNSAAPGQRIDVRCRDHSGTVFLSLGSPASACVHRLGIKHALCSPIYPCSTISCVDTDINADHLRFPPCM